VSSQAPARAAKLLLASFSLAVGCQGGGVDPDSAAGETGIEHCGEISGSETWTAGEPHVISCDLLVTGELTLEPGVEVYMDMDTALRVEGGALRAVGTEESPILLGSNAAFPYAGDCDGLQASDADLELAWFTLAHAGARGGMIELDGGTADLSQVELSYGINQGIKAEGTEFTQLSGLRISFLPTPLLLPWTAAQLLEDLVYEEVGSEVVYLPAEELSEEALLPGLDYPYVSAGVVVQGGGRLELEPGATLELAGDLTVADGTLEAQGDETAGVALLGRSDTSFAIDIQSSAAASFAYAQLTGATVTSAAEAFSFVHSSISGAQGDALTITGGLAEGGLDGNSFSGEGLGLVLPLEQVGAIGENDYSGSSWDGVGVAGDLFWGEGFAIDSWPSAPLLVLADLEFYAGSYQLTGGQLLFAKGTGLAVQAATLQASEMSFLQQDGISGAWRGITLGVGADDSWLVSCDVAQGGADEGANITLASSASVLRSTVRDSAGWGVFIEGDAEPTLEDNVYDNNALGDVGPEKEPEKKPKKEPKKEPEK